MTATLLVSPEAFDAENVEVDGDAYRHLFRARRLAVGDSLRLVDGKGRAREALVADVDRKRARLEAGVALPSLEPPLSLTLAVAPLRPERASWLVEKATELGASAIRFVAFERAVRDPGKGTKARLERVARAAVEQCGRSRVPEVTLGHDPAEIEAWNEEADHAWWLDAGGEAFPSVPVTSGRGLLVVGPEGGWADAEREAFRSWELRCVSLGPRTLRTETAAVVGAGLVLGRG